MCTIPLLKNPKTEHTIALTHIFVLLSALPPYTLKKKRCQEEPKRGFRGDAIEEPFLVP